MTGAPLERDLRALYGAYEYLRDHDLAGASTTSRLLHEADADFLAGRVRDEMDELRGAVAGTHGHGGGRDDVVLEAYQTLYWLTVLAVARGETYDRVRLHEALAAEIAGGDSGNHDPWNTPRDRVGQVDWVASLRDGFALVAAQCRRAGIDPAEAVRRDLDELRARPYLAPYWAAQDA